MPKQTLRDVDARGLRVLVRVDFNVPMEDGRISDDNRIRAALPTIQYLRERNARVVLCSHLGRPNGVVDENARLAPIAEGLEDVLGEPVSYVTECIGFEAEAAVAAMEPGEVLLLENLRFHPGEEKNDPEFAAQLAKLADLYVNDAFGTAHRAHASTAGVAAFLPAVSGLLMERELTMLGSVLEDPKRPLAAIMGGAKVSDKIAVLETLLDRVDVLVIGGGMAATFIKAMGHGVGDSLLEEEASRIRAGDDGAVRPAGRQPRPAAGPGDCRRLQGRRGVADSGGRSYPGWLAHHGRRPKCGLGLHGSDPPLRHRPVERPHGRIRVGRVFARHTRRR